MNAQQAIKAIPDRIEGKEVARLLREYAAQARFYTTGNASARAKQNVTDTIDEVESAAKDYAAKGGVFTRPSIAFSRIQTLVGKLFTMVADVDGQLDVAEAAWAGLGKDLVQNVKDLPANVFDWGKWIVVPVVLILGLVLVINLTK